MKLRLILPALLAAVRIATAENEIGFIEKFALAPDREAVLSQLIPGSEEFYFFSALHFQNTGQKDRLKRTMADWAARFPQSSQREIIENREALLGYDADPQSTLRFLRDRLNLQFNHEQQLPDRAPDLPTALDQSLISREAFRSLALTHSDDLNGFTPSALEQLVRDKTPLSPAQRRALLSKLSLPDVAGLLDLVEADLRTRESRGFGEFAIHRALLPDQLDELARRMPALLNSQPFVFTRLRKMLPNADVDLEFDAAEREAWLERVWNYAKNLSPAFNTLKARILHLRLLHDRSRGIYDKARIVEYLKLPRQTVYFREEYFGDPRAAGQPIDFNADLSEPLFAAPPIGNDEWLVRECLLRILRDEPSWEPFATFLREDYVKPLFAEAKITNGIGDPQQWAALLSPTQFQALKDRVDIDFAPSNPQLLAPADAVSIALTIKNAPRLIVKIYELNALGFFLTQKRQLNTDVNLDGLVANSEKTHDFTAEDAARNPFRSIARTFDFPELKGRRGAWMVEFIGGGKSSRALIRKGQWHVLPQTGPAGDLLTVIDETGKIVPNAVAWIDGRKIAADQTGRIPVPFTAQPGTKPIIVADANGEFATLTSFEHHAENYHFGAIFHLEREQLISGQRATLAIRPSLTVGGAPISPALLTDVSLRLTTSTRKGDQIVENSTTIPIAQLSAEAEFTHTFLVPDQLQAVSAELSTQIENLGTGEKKKLTATQSWPVNSADKQAVTAGPHLTRTTGGYVFELLGKNGEPIADRQVRFDFRHVAFHATQTAELRTDARGRIALGALNEIVLVRSSLPGSEQAWPIIHDDAQRPRTIHAKAGATIEVPWFEGAALRAEDVSLLEARAGQFVADRFAALSLDGSLLQIKGLAPGDYSLHLRRSSETIRIAVTAGNPASNWLVSPARELEVRNPAPLQIESIKPEADAVVIRLRNANALTRLHVTASRFYPRGEEWCLRAFGQIERFDPALITPARRPSLFHSGRVIGDEFRYILDRRYSKIFPGNMLPRPGLLLNPWDVRTTDAAEQSMVMSGRAGAARGDRAEARAKMQPQEKAAAEALAVAEPTGTHEPNIDFLASAAPALFNLKPDAQGIVRIPRVQLGDRHHLQVLAEDLATSVFRTAVVGEPAAKFRDLRLNRGLDPKKDFSERHEVTLLKTGDALKIDDVLTSRFEAYDSLASVHSLFSTLSHEPKLAEFSWIVRWPSLKDAEKRAKYSEFACHELSFFLSRKDPEFFRAVVEPYLRNKKEKTFLDDWLLGNDLRRYLEPWAFDRLNTAEQALLAQRLPAEAAAIARSLRERWAMILPDVSREDFLFESALLGRAFDDTGISRQAGVGGITPMDEPRPASAPAPASMTAGNPLPFMDAAVAPSAKPETPALRKALSEDGKMLEAAAERELLDRDEAQRQRSTVRQFFRKLGPAKEWAENNYHRLPLSAQGPDLIGLNRFWIDFAAWDGKRPFLSTHFPEASGNFSEMMLALAVLDLPFEAGKHATKTEQNALTVTAASPAIVFHKQIKPAVAAADAELLVTENFIRAADAQDSPAPADQLRTPKFVTDEFLAGEIYNGIVVVTNPTPTRKKLDLLLQIPRGALPVANSEPTSSRRLVLEPYSTQKLEYSFYFPAAEAEPFVHFPAHVASGEKTAGTAKPLAFRVVKQLSKIDTESWDYISQSATDAEVFQFLEKQNMECLDLSRIAWRARKSAAFFRKLIGLLASRHRYDETIYSYAVVHNDPAPLREWLRHRDDFLAKCGPWLSSRLLTIDPIERRTFEQLEYSPFVNQRAHRLGGEPRIANDIVRGQYQALLRILAHKPALDAIDEMSVVYFLFLQDRVDEALTRFAAIKPDALPTRIQHDYFRCYAAFYEQKYADARAIAASYQAHPVDRWRTLFAEVTAQLDEAEGKPAQRVAGEKPEREMQQSALANTEPSFDLKLEKRAIALTWRNLPEVTVNFYLMDPEFLFSSSPFVAEDPGRFSIIKPTRTLRQALPAGSDALTIPLPDEFAKANVLVEILGAGQRKAQAHHANTLKLAVAENYGRLELRDDAASKPVAKAYVKVYARLRGGAVRFFKDGYTDLRGRFDYASLNSPEHPGGGPIPLARGDAAATTDIQMLKPRELGEVERFAILILSEEHGALVREAVVPAE